ERIVDSGMPTALNPYTVEIVRGVVSQWTRINDLMAQTSREWSVERMPAVDRALLRIAIWEIMANPDVPTSVAIDEAVTLAEQLSTDDSAWFISGVLGAVALSVDAGTVADQVE